MPASTRSAKCWSGRDRRAIRGTDRAGHVISSTTARAVRRPVSTTLGSASSHAPRRVSATVRPPRSRVVDGSHGDDEIGESEWQRRRASRWVGPVRALVARATRAGGGRSRAVSGSTSARQRGARPSLGARLGAFLELYGLPRRIGRGRRAWSTEDSLGFGPDAQLDVRAGAGLTDAASDWLFGLGFARRW